MTNFFTNLIEFLYGLTASIGIPSHGLAIILVSILIKLVMFPLTKMQAKSMKAMQELQPQVDKLKKKHGSDKQKLNEEMAKLYQEQQINPMASCLPMLIQLPIIFTLFRAMREYFIPELNAGFLWVSNLGEPDLWILPILAGLSTFIQQKVTMGGQAAGSQMSQQKTMLYIMPLFMAWISRSFPAGLALYWFVFNVVSTIEQLIMQDKLPFGKKEGAK